MILGFLSDIQYLFRRPNLQLLTVLGRKYGHIIGEKKLESVGIHSMLVKVWMLRLSLSTYGCKNSVSIGICAELHLRAPIRPRS